MMGHLGPDVPPLNLAICYRAVADLAICELPPGSNRSGRIDTYNRRAEAPVASYWCCAWATAVWEDAGAEVPPHARASCDVLVEWAMQRGTFHSEPIAGAIVVYTSGQHLASGALDAVHVGIVVRVTPLLLSLEGNAAFTSDSRNGEAVLLKEITRARVMGYVHPRAAIPSPHS